MRTYQFAVLRYLHDHATEEFVNVGLALLVSEERELLFSATEKYARLSAFFSRFDGPRYRELLRGIVARAEEEAHRLRAESASLFRPDCAPSLQDILTAIVSADSPSFRWSPIHGGITEDAHQRIQQLMAEFVPTAEEVRGRRDDQSILSAIRQQLREAGLYPRTTQQVTVRSDHFEHTFPLAWNNGVTQVLEPISLDLQDAAQVREKAARWLGRLHALKPARFQMTGVVSRAPAGTTDTAYRDAIEILKAAPNMRRVVAEDDTAVVLRDIRGDLGIGD